MSDQTYLVKIYEINAEVELAFEKLLVPDNNTLKIQGLKPTTYWVRIEWNNNNCYKTLGGLEGIRIDPKEEKP